MIGELARKAGVRASQALWAWDITETLFCISVLHCTILFEKSGFICYEIAPR